MPQVKVDPNFNKRSPRHFSQSNISGTIYGSDSSKNIAEVTEDFNKSNFSAFLNNGN